MAFVRALKEKAEYKIFHIPLDISVQGMALGTSIMHARHTLGHLHYFYKDTALATLTDCGYEIVDFNYTHGAETLPNRKLKTKLLNIVRKLVRSLNEDAAVRLLGGASILVLAK